LYLLVNVKKNSKSVQLNASRLHFTFPVKTVVENTMLTCNAIKNTEVKLMKLAR
jgi:hypothetical protein